MVPILVFFLVMATPAIVEDDAEQFVKNAIHAAMPSGDPEHPSWYLAAEKLKEPLAEGVPWAKYYASFLYAYGAAGFARNIEVADQQALSAAEAGYLPAIVDRARRLEYGLSGIRDLRKAANWYEKAAIAGSRSAASRLVQAYVNGELEFPRDEEMAATWRAHLSKCTLP